MSLKYYSTNLKAPEVSFREALIGGLAPDGGLYMPRSIPQLAQDEIYNFKKKNYPEIAFQVLKCLLADDIDKEILMDLCLAAYNFEIPVERVFERTYILRLDHGPTLSFKDFAARMMARLMHFYTSRDRMNFTILTATSGDTGSAVANAFHGLSNIDVIILFPVREVTDYQRKQMTTLGKNISVIAIDGKFDDCQHLVKRAFLDTSLFHCSLTSANSINIGRLLPQSVYYFYAWSRMAENIDDKVIFSVPSGNYGNLMGGVIAREMGLPVEKFIISANENNEVPEYLKNGVYNIISPSINCISSAMNVGHPSNLARLIALYGGVMDQKGVIVKDPDLAGIRKDFSGFSVNDADTRHTIEECYRKYRLLVEPHGAVAWKGIEHFRKANPADMSEKQLFVSLETAHPAKFREEMLNILGFSPPVPDQLLRIENIEENYTELENDYEQLKDFILKL